MWIQALPAIQIHGSGNCVLTTFSAPVQYHVKGANIPAITGFVSAQEYAFVSLPGSPPYTVALNLSIPVLSGGNMAVATSATAIVTFVAMVSPGARTVTAVVVQGQ